MSAAQAFIFTRYFGLIIRDLVPTGHFAWELYTSLQQNAQHHFESRDSQGAHLYSKRRSGGALTFCVRRYNFRNC